MLRSDCQQAMDSTILDVLEQGKQHGGLAERDGRSEVGEGRGGGRLVVW